MSNLSFRSAVSTIISYVTSQMCQTAETVSVALQNKYCYLIITVKQKGVEGVL